MFLSKSVEKIEKLVRNHSFFMTSKSSEDRKINRSHYVKNGIKETLKLESKTKSKTLPKLNFK